MSTTETRIGVVAFLCSGCDCGTCVSETIGKIEELSSVEHVSLDHRSNQIVITHEAGDGTSERLAVIVSEGGLELSE